MTARFAASVVLTLGLIAGAAGRSDAGPTVVFDPRTGEVLAEERAGEPWYPASLTKLMTAYVVFRKLAEGKLKLDQPITMSALAADQQPSKIGVAAGRTVTVDFALQSLLVYSANDMAYALAEAASGSVPAFVAEMNASAEQLGLKGTYFANPNGWFDPRQVTTARDIGILASVILLEFPERGHYFSQPVLRVGKRKLANRNGLLRRMKGADGMKTGFICNSGYNLVASATLEGRKLVAVVLGAQSGQARVDEAEELLAQGFLKPRVAGARRLTAITDAALDSLVPADLTNKVCRAKSEVPPVRAADLGGWGISLGRYSSALDAYKAVRGRMLGARHLITGGEGGVVRIAGSEGHNAMFWRLSEKNAIDICVHFARQNVPCDVLPPETFARIAVLAPAEAKPAVSEQGGEEDDAATVKDPPRKPKAKQKRKRVKSKVR